MTFARMRIQWPSVPGAHGSSPKASTRRSSAVAVISSQTPVMIHAPPDVPRVVDAIDLERRPRGSQDGVQLRSHR
jgi:hypothetical protein